MVEGSGDECHPTATDVKECCQAIGKILKSQGLSLLGLPEHVLIARTSNEKPSLRTALLCCKVTLHHPAVPAEGQKALADILLVHYHALKLQLLNELSLGNW